MPSVAPSGANIGFDPSSFLLNDSHASVLQNSVVQSAPFKSPAQRAKFFSPATQARVFEPFARTPCSDFRVLPWKQAQADPRFTALHPSFIGAILDSPSAMMLTMAAQSNFAEAAPMVIERRRNFIMDICGYVACLLDGERARVWKPEGGERIESARVQSAEGRWGVKTGEAGLGVRVCVVGE